MVLRAQDELRHPKNDDYYFRESLYFNFNDPTNEIGAWFYYWVTPNKESPAGMLVSLYHGRWTDLKINDHAMSASGHLLTSENAWVYCFKKDVDFQLETDFDDTELCGLHLRRVEPLKHYKIKFSDGEGNIADLDVNFMMEPYDYADGVNPTPSWVAANRYHRSHWTKGQLKIAGKTYNIDCTGDSDHSWGQRHMGVFVENLFKMWSFQSADGRTSISAIQQGPEGKEFALGFVVLDGKVSSVATVEHTSRYDENGVQENVDLKVIDALGRVVNAKFKKMHSHIASGDNFWGYEGVGDYEVEGFGVLPGLISYFWPKQITAGDLHAGKRR